MPAKLSAQWFKKDARIFTTMLGTNMCLVGYILAYNLSNYIVTLYGEHTGYTGKFKPFTPIDCKLWEDKAPYDIDIIIGDFQDKMTEYLVVITAL